MKLHGITVNSRVDDSKEEKDVAANNETVKEVAETSKVENIEANDSKKEFLSCELCDYKCKKMISLQKHLNTKHEEQKCNLCDKKFENAMDLINHKAEEHSTPDIQIRDIKAQDKKKASKENKDNEEIVHPGEGEFQCDKCMKIVPNKDTFDKHKKHGLGKTCTLCSILNYGKN